MAVAFDSFKCKQQFHKPLLINCLKFIHEIQLNFTSNSSSYFWAYNATLSQICDLIKSKGPASSSSS